MSQENLSFPRQAIAQTLWQLFANLMMILGAVLTLLPLVIVVATACLVTGESLDPGVPHWGIANFQQAWRQGDFLLAFANSLFVALGVAAGQIFTSTLAGYALARLHFDGRNIVLLLVLATLVIPFQLLVIPIFLLLTAAGLINTYGALILPTVASGFSIFLMRQYFLTIPGELEEAAMLDGANRLQILGWVLLPLARPAIVTVALFTFVGEWNDLFKPLVFTTRPELRTVQLALAELQEQFTNDWSVLMAAVAITTVPVIVVFLLGQRQFIRGIANTGIKG